MPKVSVAWEGMSREIFFEGTPLLASLLRENGYPLDTPCGGRGLCGKCRVEASGALSMETAAEHAAKGRLACQTRLLGDARVTLPALRVMENIAASGVRPPFALAPLRGRYGMAVDIGTTTLAATLLRLESGETLASATAENPQRAVAADVIGRMEAAMAGQAGLLQNLITGAIEHLRAGLCAQAGIPAGAIDQTVITGNTTMLYLYAGKDPEPLSHAPFRADCLFGLHMDPQEAHIYIPRCVSAFVGADITCAILASRLCANDETALLADIGTNGEIALRHKGRLYVCATAAGPAFEGGGIEHGCGSIAGAIDRVWAQDGKPAFSTIGCARTLGICGSGVIDLAATLLKLGQLDETGLLSGQLVRLDENIWFTQKDVRNVQLAKSAVTAGILTLCQTVGVSLDDIGSFYLAGGFGKHIDLESAAAIGLIPQALTDRTRVIGNAALAGAEMLLLQEGFAQESETFAREAEVVVLSGNPLFSGHYVSCMTLEPV